MGMSMRGARSRLGHVLFGLILGIMLLGLTVGASAQEGTPTFGKGLYTAGLSYFVQVSDNRTIEWKGVNADTGERKTYGAVDIPHSADGGSVGACVFHSAIYAFFISGRGELQYVKANASTGLPMFDFPKTITDGHFAAGAAAAVMGGRIYVFTASDTFSSSDGSHYTRCFSGPDAADTILDAVAFYPPDDAPPLPDSKVLGAIMVFFTHGTDLETEIFQGPDYGFSGAPAKLSNPLSHPVVQGNCILGTVAESNLGPAGAKDPCIQFYGCADWYEGGLNVNYEYGRWEYDQKSGHWTAEKWMTNNYPNQVHPGLIVAPWFEEVDTTSHLLQLWQVVDDTTYVDNHVVKSDYMVPTYSDNDWQGEYTDTYDAAPGSDMASLWTLVGVILGPPPFPANGATQFCDPPYERSWVEYENDSTTDVTVTSTSSSTVSIASDTKIQAGIGEAELDLSYAHGWTSTHGSSTEKSVSKEYHFGPCAENDPNNPGAEGIHGYAIFNAPTLTTQRYKLYAYDYNHSDGSGTYLGQSIYTTSTAKVYQQSAYFELKDPSKGGPDDLLTGMHAYPDSTDLTGWEDDVPDWNGGGSGAWKAIFQPSQVLNMPGSQTVYFSESDTTITSKGNSNSFGVKAGGGLNIKGFSQSLTVGYDGEWTTETENKSTVTTAVGCQIDVPIPGGDSPSGYVKQYTVQPFWLQAKTADAPWIPTGYSGDLPWCTTWSVTGIQTVGGSQTGMAAPPALAQGKVRHGGEKARDTYEVDGGALSWMDPYGGEIPLEMTADQFDPDLGASVALNGYVFPADGSKGKWVRNGDVWKYKTRDGVKKDPFKLTLDFGTGTWSFKGASKHLDQAIEASLGNVRMDLTVEGLYRFTSRVQCNVNCTWNQKEAKADRHPYGVHRVKGEYDSSTGSGSLVLKGHLPKGTDAYGDVEILVNGSPVEIPLLSTQDFLQKLEQGSAVDYEADGIAYKINFGKGKWKLKLDGAAFKKAMAPDKGAVRVQVLVGGVSTSDQTFELSHTNTGLTYGG